jgi:hypothetical protein
LGSHLERKVVGHHLVRSQWCSITSCLKFIYSCVDNDINITLVWKCWLNSWTFWFLLQGGFSCEHVSPTCATALPVSSLQVQNDRSYGSNILFTSRKGGLGFLYFDFIWSSICDWNHFPCYGIIFISIFFFLVFLILCTPTFAPVKCSCTFFTNA